jgi:hypothetical protein
LLRLVILLTITIYFRFDRGVVHIVVAGYIVYHYCFIIDRVVVHIVVAGYIVDNYCFMFDRGVVHIVVSVLLLNIIISGLTEECFILLWLVILSTITV